MSAVKALVIEVFLKGALSGFLKERFLILFGCHLRISSIVEMFDLLCVLSRFGKYLTEILRNLAVDNGVL